MEFYPVLRQSGIVTVPSQIRHLMELEEGDRLVMTVERVSEDEADE